MEFINLKTTARSATGNGPSKALRRQDGIPAVLYGPHADTMLLSVKANEFELALQNRSISQLFLNLEIQHNGNQIKTAIIKELQVHPVSRKYLHVDFYEIAMDRKIKVKVPVTTRGKAKGIEEGGMLQIIRRELEVFCLPMEVPESIEIDITSLDVGDSIHVEDIPLQGHLEISAEVNFTVLTILNLKAEAAREAESEEPEAEETEDAQAEGDDE